MMLEVDDHALHVYAEGQGDRTLVFLAGHGTSSPTLDFKPLWQRMTDEYRIVLVERTGCEWSDDASIPRDLGAILDETRTVLERADEAGRTCSCHTRCPALRRSTGPRRIPERWRRSSVLTR